MFSRVFTRTKKETNIEVGTILIAQPFWQDEKYKRSVIMILDHNYDGSRGIILNKLSTLTVDEVLPELEINSPLHYGGPLNPEIISFIHNYPSFPQTFSLGNELFFDGNYDYLLRMLEEKNIAHLTIKELSDKLKENGNIELRQRKIGVNKQLFAELGERLPKSVEIPMKNEMVSVSDVESAISELKVRTEIWDCIEKHASYYIFAGKLKNRSDVLSLNVMSVR